MTEYRVITTWSSGGSTTYAGLDYTQAMDLAFAHRAHGHTCAIAKREIGHWTKIHQSDGQR